MCTAHLPNCECALDFHTRHVSLLLPTRVQVFWKSSGLSRSKTRLCSQAPLGWASQQQHCSLRATSPTNSGGLCTGPLTLLWARSLCTWTSPTATTHVWTTQITGTLQTLPGSQVCMVFVCTNLTPLCAASFVNASLAVCHAVSATMRSTCAVVLQ